MASAVIGALRVVLGLDSAEFNRGAGRAQNQINALQSRLNILSTAFAAAGTALGALTVSVANAVSDIQRFSQVANTTPTELQKWAAAAKSVGVEQDKVADILKDVNDKVGDFLQTGGGPMLDFFEQVAPRVGVTADQFRNLSGPQALQLYVSSLEKANLSQADMTFYMEAIANDATLLLPLLRNNGQQLQQLGDRARDLGAILDQTALTKLNALKSATGEVGLVFAGLKNKIATELAPSLTTLSNAFVRAFETGGLLRGIVDWIIANLGRLTAYATAAVTVFGVRYVGAFVSARVATLSLGAALVALRAAIVRTGIGILIAAAGELFYQFGQLIEATGSWRSALQLLQNVAVGVWENIKVRFVAMQYRIAAGWESLKAAAFRAMQSVVSAVYNSVNSIIGAFVGAYRAIINVWRAIPGAVGDLVIQAVNATIAGIESLLNNAISKVNNFIAGVNSAIGKVGIDIQIDAISNINFSRVATQYAGQAAAAGQKISTAFLSGLNDKYVNTPQLFGRLAAEAEAAGVKLVNMSDAAWAEAQKPIQAITELKAILAQTGDEAIETAQKSEESLNKIGSAAGQAGKKAGKTGKTKAAEQKKVGPTAPIVPPTKPIDDYNAALESMKKLWGEIDDQAVDAFASIVTGSASAKDAIGQLLMSVANMLAKEAFSSFFGSVFGSSAGSSGGGIFDGLVDGIASGITSFLGFANGTPFAPGGLALVGERGPELVNLPRGSQVSTAQETKALLSGGQTTVVVSLSPDLEARILNEADNNAVQIVNNRTPGIVRQSVSAVREANRETGTYLGRV